MPELTTLEAVPFPNPQIEPQIAKLQTIKFSLLLDRNDFELAKLIKACETDGFFYLDLSDEGADKLYKDLDSASSIVKKWMSQPREKKCQTYTSK